MYEAVQSMREENSTNSRTRISVVIPLYNEAENIKPLINSIFPVLRNLGLEYEVILVNDGSTDGTQSRLKEFALPASKTKVVNLKRNYGQTAAIMAGIHFARGQVIVTMDGDLQNDPADIPLFLAKLNEGYDVVSGWRKHRRDALSRTLLSKAANVLISLVSGVRLHDYGCTLKAYRREVIENVHLYGEMHRFIPIYASWEGGRVAEIVVTHHPRTHGKSKYGLNRIFKVVLDLLLVKFFDRHQTKPIYIFGGFGILCLLGSFSTFVVAIYLKLVYQVYLIQTPLLLLAVMTFLTGIMCLLMGILAEMIVRTYFEAQDKPVYLVRDVINVETSE
jgi:glycosyltransferase involved in cell wall biosynthesis